MMASYGARRAAVEALLQVAQDGYSNIVLEELLQRRTVADSDRALTTRLVYGVTERRLTIDFLLNRLSDTPVIKMTDVIREILRVGVYQLVYMDKIPAFAAISESVELTRAMGHARLTGYVNGVLRAVQRQAEALLAELPATDKGLEIRHSCPRAWIRSWRGAYGEEALQGMLSCINEAPPTYLRVNTRRTTTDALVRELASHGVTCERVEGLPDALAVSVSQPLRQLPEALQHQFYFQDLASQWCCAALGAQPNERIADVCAAPGGKSFTVAQYMQDRGVIDAADLYEQRAAIIGRRAAAYGFSCITAACRDASAEPSTDRWGQYDRVICDAPCSGIGVIRRKPEIRYKQPEDFATLPSLQLSILSQAAKLVRVGGVLQYSTCTLRREENEAVATAFLESHPSFAPRLLPITACFERAGVPVSHEITLMPHIHGSDGFYIAGFVRKSS